jgi:hypothetical protein
MPGKPAGCCWPVVVAQNNRSKPEPGGGGGWSPRCARGARDRAASLLSLPATALTSETGRGQKKQTDLLLTSQAREHNGLVPLCFWNSWLHVHYAWIARCYLNAYVRTMKVLSLA